MHRCLSLSETPRPPSPPSRRQTTPLGPRSCSRRLPPRLFLTPPALCFGGAACPLAPRRVSVHRRRTPDRCVPFGSKHASPTARFRRQRVSAARRPSCPCRPLPSHLDAWRLPSLGEMLSDGSQAWCLRRHPHFATAFMATGGTAAFREGWVVSDSESLDIRRCSVCPPHFLSIERPFSFCGASSLCQSRLSSGTMLVGCCEHPNRQQTPGQTRSVVLPLASHFAPVSQMSSTQRASLTAVASVATRRAQRLSPLASLCGHCLPTRTFTGDRIKSILLVRLLSKLCFVSPSSGRQPNTVWRWRARRPHTQRSKGKVQDDAPSSHRS